MKNATPELQAFLQTARTCVKPDLFTLTLKGGTVLRYTDAGVPVTFGLTTWFMGPGIKRGSISNKRGIEVGNLEMTFYPRSVDLIGGVPFIPFVRAGGLDGATVLVETGFGPIWSQIVGKLIKFSGRVTSITNISGTEVTVQVSSWLELLNQNMPRNLVQPPCLHTLFDAGCGLDKTDWAVNGSVVTSGGFSAFVTDLGEADGYFDQGTMVFTSGANAGQIRTIRSQVGAGVSVVLPLPAEPQPGDDFTAYPGCDRTKETCAAKFDNLLRYRGFKYVPTPETSV